MTFQTTTMIIAIVVLILCLIIIGYMLNKNKYNSQYPPVISECPDYWLDRSDGDGSNCINSQGLGRTNCAKKMDFSGTYWTGQDGLCNKNKWAKTCNLTWDGVTNNLNACDTTSS